jgi:hypothetical protein
MKLDAKRSSVKKFHQNLRSLSILYNFQIKSALSLFLCVLIQNPV